MHKKYYRKFIVILIISLCLIPVFLPCLNGNVNRHRNNQINVKNFDLISETCFQTCDNKIGLFNKNLMINKFFPFEVIDNQEIVEIRIYQFRKNGSVEEISKRLTYDDNNQMMNCLIQTEISKSDPKEIFEEKLEILKEYDILSSNITLEDIMDEERFEFSKSKPFNISEMNPFSAHFCPIFIGGMGFGIGFGFRGLPIVKRIAGNIITAGLIGLGTVLCLDIFKNILHFQLTFTLPFLIHIITGFVGIMLFAFDSVFPPIPGKPPITIYSNIVAIGIAGSAIGFLVPP